MTRPICMVDGSDNKTIIPAYGFRQCLSKDTGLGGGNINVDFTSGDLTDFDAGDPPILPNNVLMEPNQAYFCCISRLAQASLAQVRVCNINFTKGLGTDLQANVYKIMVADNPVFLRFRLNSNQNMVRFRFLGMLVTDNIRVSLAKMS